MGREGLRATWLAQETQPRKMSGYPVANEVDCHYHISIHINVQNDDWIIRITVGGVQLSKTSRACRSMQCKGHDLHPT